MDRTSESSVRSGQIERVVEIRRIVWGDHEVRFVASVSSELEHIEAVREDAKRLGDVANDRVRAYSFSLLERDAEGVSLVCEDVAYGTSKKIEKKVSELWSNFIHPY